MTTPMATPPTTNDALPAAASEQDAPAEDVVRGWDDIGREVDERGLVTKEVKVPEFRTKMWVRGLTRAEKHYLNGSAFRDTAGRLNAPLVEEEMLCLAVVRPPLSHERYKVLRHNSAINPVFDRLLAGINELTNGTTLEDAVAAAEARFRPGQ